MSLKKSVCLSTETEDTCNALAELTADKKMNWSKTLNSITINYNYLLELTLPKLPDNEMLIYCLMYSGRGLNSDIRLEVRGFLAVVIDSVLHNEDIVAVLEKNNMQTHDIIEKSQSFNDAQRLAIIDFTQRFWATKTPKEEE